MDSTWIPSDMLNCWFIAYTAATVRRTCPCPLSVHTWSYLWREWSVLRKEILFASFQVSGELSTFPPNPTSFYLFSFRAKCWVRGGRWAVSLKRVMIFPTTAMFSLNSKRCRWFLVEHKLTWIWYIPVLLLSSVFYLVYWQLVGPSTTFWTRQPNDLSHRAYIWFTTTSTVRFITLVTIAFKACFKPRVAIVLIWLDWSATVARLQTSNLRQADFNNCSKTLHLSELCQYRNFY